MGGSWIVGWMKGLLSRVNLGMNPKEPQLWGNDLSHAVLVTTRLE